MQDETAERPAAGREHWSTTRALRWFALAALLSACSGAESGGDQGPISDARAVVAPSPPLLVPELPDVSESDRDRDQIDDAFQAQIYDGAVDLEVILNAPTLQRHLDAFLSLGGQVEHVFRAVSYGWTGTLAREKLTEFRDELGSDLRLIAAPKPVSLFLDEATRTGRVRPVWQPNFAGIVSGVTGDSSITIGILDTGVDATHLDLVEGMVGFTDYTADKIPIASDIVGHGTHVTSIAVGTGAAFGIGPGTLRYTTSGLLSSLGAGAFTPGVIHTPNYFGSTSTLTASSNATWLGGPSTSFYLLTAADSSATWTQFASTMGPSPRSLGRSNVSNAPARFSDGLTQASSGTITNFAVANTVANYPAVGDGFGALRGVAPGCKWYGAKVFGNSGAGNSADIGKALDDMVTLRIEKKIKIVNLSLGISGGGTDSGLRSKANTVVDNGIIVVVAAGNDGPNGTIGDPGRAAKVLTIGASNDKNELTTYTSKGSSMLDAGADYKPDVLAPGGSSYRSMILAADSNTCDGRSSAFADQVKDDYTALQGTSMASPFAAGAAALLIDALQKSGVNWSSNSNKDALLIKMLMLASATETNATREPPQAAANSPSLGRAAAPKDLYEGFGLLNPDAAIEALSQTLPANLSGSVSNTAPNRLEWERRAWGRHIALSSGSSVTLDLNVPSTADFDLYLYAGSPDSNGNPSIRASSTNAGLDADESLSFQSSATETAYVFVKRISGYGSFSLATTSSNPSGGSGGASAGGASAGGASAGNASAGNASAGGASLAGAGGTGSGSAGSAGSGGKGAAGAAGDGAGGGASGGSGSRGGATGGNGTGGGAAGGASGEGASGGGAAGADGVSGGANFGGAPNSNPGTSAGAPAGSAGEVDESEPGNANGGQAGAESATGGGNRGVGAPDVQGRAGDASVVPTATPTAAAVDQSSGCGCAEAGSDANAAAGLWFLGALTLAGARRRRA